MKQWNVLSWAPLLDQLLPAGHPCVSQRMLSLPGFLHHHVEEESRVLARVVQRVPLAAKVAFQ